MNDQQKRFNAKKENQFVNRDRGFWIPFIETICFLVMAFFFAAFCCAM